MKGAVSKIASKVQTNYTLARAVQNGRPALLSTCGRVPYHTFAAPRTRVQPVAPTLDTFHTALLNNFNAVAQPAAAEFIPRLPREIVWLLGAPGAGKGTNSSHVALSCGIQSPTIVMSSLLENSECKRIKDAGGMVDDAIAFKALMKELSKPQYRDGAVVDGFPRTKEQAEWLKRMHDSLSERGLPPPTFTFVMLSLSEDTSIARQLSRGNTIRELNTLRAKSGMDALEVRATDVCEDAARTRYSVFAQQVDAVTQLSAQFRLAVVDADAPIESVRSRLTSALKPTPFPSSSFSSPSSSSSPSSLKGEKFFTSSLFSSLGRLAFA